MIKLGVSGCMGRMGQRISALAFKDEELQVTALTEYPGYANLPEDIQGVSPSKDNSVYQNCDVVIEFTLPEGTLANLAKCKELGVPMVIGTTGFSDDELKQLEEASKTIPVLWSTNMSVGVNLLWKLIEQTAKVTGKDYRMEIEETHHVHKKDAPSGTAKTMIEIAETHAGKKVDQVTDYREGEVIGDHSITFESEVDILGISHSAKTRDIFAEGSLLAAKWLVNQKPGLYHMRDVLNLS